MPFTSETAAEAGRKSRIRKDPAVIRKIYLPLRITQGELDMIADKAKAAEISRTELIVRAVRDYDTRKEGHHVRTSTPISRGR